jgi:hypothetical protein
MYPALYVASYTSASCSDFAVYPTGQAGSANAANIIAYSNLYTGGCTAPVPSVYWAYNTGPYAVTTSPILSVDGKQIAFIESNGTTASLVLIKWASETGESVNAPLTLTNSASGSAYHLCTPTSAPCMFTIAFANGKNDTLSAPFYDFFASDDALYVGDDNGYLHKFTGVFVGSPTEVTSTWPVQLNVTAGTKISSPVYDSNSGNVFVGDSTGVLYSVAASGTTKYNTGSLGDIIADAPMVDVSAGTLYAFVTTSASGKPYTGDNVVVQFTTGFTAYGSPGTVYVGTGGAGYYLYAGDFDNVFYESLTNTGNLYVVGNTGATTGATLYRAGITSGYLSGTVTSAATGLTTSGAYPWPSPLTEFCNGTCTVSAGVTNGNDYVFFSVNQAAVGSCTPGAANGCILSYNVSNPASAVISGTGLKVTTPGAPGCWATGGIVPDNSAATTGASQIYFVNLNGAAAGGAGGTPTSSKCTAGAGPTIDATQASQSSP